MNGKYKVLDLFSGIGGFSLGLERAGMTTTAFCEIEPYCRKVLRQHWPEVKIHEDIKQLDGKQYDGAIDLICGGYPCQPFSTAGKQLAEEDPRHLWPEMRRIIREARPRWVVCENVRGHVRLGFDTVASQLEDDGFTVWPFIVPASAVCAPHRRDRLWIVAHHSGDGRGTGWQRRFNSGCQGQSEQALPAMANAGGRRFGGASSREVEQPWRAKTICPGEAVADAHREWQSQSERPFAEFGRWAGNCGETLADAQSGGGNESATSRSESYLGGSGKAREINGQPTGRHCCPGPGETRGSTKPRLGRGPHGVSAWLDFPDRWADGTWENGIPRVATSVPGRVPALKALGNAVVPELPYRIGKTIMAYEQQLAMAA